MNFLQLCQRVAQESGTVPGTDDPSTVTGQEGRLKRIVDWTSQAYLDIQRLHTTWRWLQEDFSGSTIAGTQSYDAAALNIASRFSHWLHLNEARQCTFSIYKTSEGQAGEGLLTYREWRDFRQTLNIGTHDNNKPVCFTVDPNNNIVFYPTPDDAYTIRGVYQKAPQTLAADGDEPEMPEQHHMAIVWKALLYLGTFDEGAEQLPVWDSFFQGELNSIEDLQLPHIRRAQPLA
jgi:hypothetical protein